MTSRILIAAAPLALLMTAACSKAPTEAESANAAMPAANEIAVNEVVANTAAPAATGPLSAYVGKYTFDKVDGQSFLDQPLVKAGVNAAVGDVKIRDFVFHSTGPSAPIALKDGRVLAWGCEEHNCGYHNWSVAITPDGADAQVCFYHNDKAPDGESLWYLPGGKTEKRAGNCPSE